MYRFSRTDVLFLFGLFSCLVLPALVPGASAAPYAIGDSVSLSGSAYATDQVYLFVTGPDLSTNGVNPDNMKIPVVSGNPSTFVVVEVTDGSWSYTWVTAQTGIKLKDGIYSVYAVKRPLGKNDLPSNDPSLYSSTDVTLTKGGRPYYSNGWILVQSEPSGATIYFNDQVSGATPRNLTAPIGTSTLRLEMTGYLPVTKEVTVDRGDVVLVDQGLTPVVTTEATASPTEPTPQPTTVNTTVPTHKLPLSPVFALAALACIAFVFAQKRN